MINIKQRNEEAKDKRMEMEAWEAAYQDTGCNSYEEHSPKEKEQVQETLRITNKHLQVVFLDRYPLRHSYVEICPLNLHIY